MHKQHFLFLSSSNRDCGRTTTFAGPLWHCRAGKGLQNISHFPFLWLICYCHTHCLLCLWSLLGFFFSQITKISFELEWLNCWPSPFCFHSVSAYTNTHKYTHPWDCVLPNQKSKAWWGCAAPHISTSYCKYDVLCSQCFLTFTTWWHWRSRE